MNAAEIDALNWDKGDGLLPAIVQHAYSGRVLMLGFVNRSALAQCFERGRAVFYSRTREALWTKGETSGNTLALVSIEADCDRDTLLLSALPAGPTCHRDTEACFDNSRPFLAHLEHIVAERFDERPPDSYTTRLAEAGVRACAQKVGEEGVEFALAATTETDERVVSEAADLVFHLLAALRQRGLGMNEVLEELARRNST